MSTPRDRIEAKLGLTGPPLSHLRDGPPRIPDHELIRRIGRGAYGEVWLARNALGTLRAVKIVYRDTFKDARPYEREFAGIRRFEPLSRSNEGFVDILQVGRDDAGGWFYYVMELADTAEPQASNQSSVIGDQSSVSSNQSSVIGDQSSVSSNQALNTDHCSLITSYTPRTLSRDLQQRRRLPLEECLELGMTLSFALGHLHRQGLIHRDIKPSNIIFVGGVPKLADIGLVTEAEGANTFVGTEGFIPPEGPTSPQADLYALGKVLYEAAMGKDRNEFPEPFTQIGTDRESVALMELNAVLLRACAPDPKARYASAEEMHADLALLHSGGSVKRRHQFERQFRIVKQVGAAAIVATLLIGAAWFWQRQQTKQMTRLAAEKSELADTNARLATEKGAAASESHRRLIQTQTANGLRAMDENDPATAALWFTEVLKHSEGDASMERRQRERLAALFRLLPKPIARLSLEHGGESVRTSPDGRWIIGVGGLQKEGLGVGEVRIWDASSFRPLHSLVISNILGRAFVSPSGRWVVVSEGTTKRIWDVTSGRPLERRLEAEGVSGTSAWSSDETRLATTEKDGTNVYLLEALSGRLLAPPLQHSNKVVKVAFDPTGRWLATGTEILRDESIFPPNNQFRPGDYVVGQARIWNAATGQPLTDWIDLDDPGYGIEFNPDGSAVAVFGIGEHSDRSADQQNSVRVIELPSGRERFAPLLQMNALQSASFSPDGRYLATGNADRSVTVWNARTGEAVHRSLKHENDDPQFLRFSPDGAWLAVAGLKEIRLWDVRSGKTVLPALKGGEVGSHFDFSSDGQQLITLTRSGRLRVWDLAGVGPALPPFFHGDGEPIASAVFSPDGKSVCTASIVGHLRIWDAVSGLPRGETLISTNEPVDMAVSFWTRAAWSSDGTSLVVPAGDYTGRIWDAATGNERPFSLRHKDTVFFTEFSPDGKQVVTASADATARIWDSITGAPLTPPLQHRNWVNAARFSPNGQRVVTASSDGTARVWDATTGAPVSPPLEEGRSKEGGTLIVMDACFSPDGLRVAMGGGSCEATIRDAVTGQRVGLAMQHGATIWRLRFSPDGRRLLTTSNDRTARVWDAGTGQPIAPPLLHDQIVVSGDFSPDGLRVITGSDDGTARIWDAATGEPLGPALRHQQGVLHVSFSPDGRRVSTVSRDALAQLWETGALDWTVGELAGAARLLAGRQVGSSEQIETLDASQLEDAWHLVGSRLEGTATSTESAARWQWRQMISSEWSRDWAAAEFHARRLIALQPGNAAALGSLTRISNARPPARNPAAPAELIDLSNFYNAALSESWHGGADNYLAELPRGIQTLAGTRFDVRGLIQVFGVPSSREPRYQYPKAVNGIRVNRKLQRLQFLHAICGSCPSDGTTVGHYFIHFASGRRETVPIVFGRDARDWHELPDQPVGVTDAVIAWKGTNPTALRGASRGIRLFKRTWENPAPDVEITKVDFVAEYAFANPFLVALTAE